MAGQQAGVGQLTPNDDLFSGRELTHERSLTPTPSPINPGLLTLFLFACLLLFLAPLPAAKVVAELVIEGFRCWRWRKSGW